MPLTPLPPKPKATPCQKHDEESEYDSIVLAVLLKIQSRARLGKKKYGTDLDRTDLNKLDWINHAQEEAMDLILYLERLKKDLQNA